MWLYMCTLYNGLPGNLQMQFSTGDIRKLPVFPWCTQSLESLDLRYIRRCTNYIWRVCRGKSLSLETKRFCFCKTIMQMVIRKHKCKGFEHRNNYKILVYLQLKWITIGKLDTTKAANKKTLLLLYHAICQFTFTE